MNHTPDRLRVVLGASLVGATAVGLLLLGAPTRAHGPAPVALSVLSIDGDAAVAVHTNIGLATARGDGSYDYVCPSRWDGNERARAYATPDGSTLLVHSLGVAYRSIDMGCSFNQLDLDGYVITATPFQDGFAVLVEQEGHVRTLRIDAEGMAAPLPLALPASPNGLHGQGEALWITGAGPPTFAARWDGALTLLWQGTLDEPVPSRVVPVAAEERAVWIEATGSSLALLRVDADGLGARRAFERSRHGPIELDGRAIALFDGVLHEWQEGDWHSLGERAWTCLEQRPPYRLACSLEGTLSLSGDEAAPFFSLQQLGRPRACGDDAAQIECEREWAHFGGESGWLDTDPALDPRSPRRAPGCAIGLSENTRPLGGWLALFALLWIRQNRRARKPMPRSKKAPANAGAF